MSKAKVLVVEDERIVAEDIKGRLQKLGYTVQGMACSGEEAIKKAEETHPDLVLMDIVLEGKMNGIEASKIIGSRFNIPFVYLTAYADDKTLEKAKVTEPYGYILKPFEDRELQTIIEIALHKYRMGALLRESEERYRSVVENAHDAIYIITNDNIQYANPALEKLTGWKKEELCSKGFDFWRIVYPDDIKLVKKRREVRKKEKENHSSFEFRIISKGSVVKTVETNAIMTGEDGGPKEIGILRDITERKLAEEERKKSYERLRKSLEETVDALASAQEIRDPYTAGHQKRVTELACDMAKEMGLTEEKIDGLRLAGLIHDVGKIRIPGEILTNPGRLTELDFNVIETHPKVGYDILKTIEFPYPVAKIVLQHHERINGSGYPSGLKGNKILIEARIIAVADVVEAMASHRPYRPALGLNKAKEEISKNKGILYDPEAVNACLKILSKNKKKGSRLNI